MRRQTGKGGNDGRIFDQHVHLGKSGPVFSRHPAQIALIYIRNITAARRDDARLAKAFAGVEAAKWVLFEDAGEIRGQ